MSHTMQSGLRIQSLKTQFAFIALLLVSTPVLADGRPQRFSLGLGLASTSGLPQEGVQVNFVLSGEYEYPVNQFFGLGLASSYIFSNPGLLLIAAPVVSVHPFGTGLLVNAAPLFQFGSSTGFGVRFGTRVPISLGESFSVIPTFSVDIVGGKVLDTMIGLGIQI